MKKIISILLFVVGIVALLAVLAYDPIQEYNFPDNTVVVEKRPDLGKLSVAYVKDGTLTFEVISVNRDQMNRAVVGKPFP